jgi:hypothetical protein
MTAEKITVRLSLPQQKNNRRLTPFWCASCAHLVTMVSTQEAGFRLKTRTNEVDKGDLHSIKTSTGRLMICLDSL